jgi:hypothetical protein
MHVRFLHVLYTCPGLTLPRSRNRWPRTVILWTLISVRWRRRTTAALERDHSLRKDRFRPYLVLL